MLLEGARKKQRKSPRGKSKDRQSESSDKDEKFLEINIRWLYVFYLSARNLHVPAAFLSCTGELSRIVHSQYDVWHALHNCCYCAFAGCCLPGNCLVLLCPTGSCCVCPARREATRDAAGASEERERSTRPRRHKGISPRSSGSRNQGRGLLVAPATEAGRARRGGQ